MKICLFINFIYNNFPSKILKSIYSVTQNYNIELIIFCGSLYNEENNVHKYNIYNYLDKQNIDGIVFVSTDTRGQINYDEQFQFFEHFKNIPLINIGIPINNIPSIVVDNELGMKLILKHLIEEHKYEKIAFISGPENNYDAVQRLDSFKKIMTEYKYDLNNDYIYFGDYCYNSGNEAIITFLDKRNISFDAVVSANDYMAIGAISELKKRKIKVPNDIAVIGFDNIDKFRFINPELTTVNVSLQLIGRKAILNLISLINRKKIDNILKIPVQFIQRKSCGCSYKKIQKNNYPESKNNLVFDNNLLSEFEVLVRGFLSNFFDFKIIKKISQNYFFSLNKAINCKNNHELIMIINKTFNLLISKGLDYVLCREIYKSILKLCMKKIYCIKERVKFKFLILKIENFLLKKTLSYAQDKNKNYTSLDWEIFLITNHFMKIYSFDGLKEIIESEFMKLGITSFYLFYDNENKDDYFDFSIIFKNNKFYYTKNKKKDLFSEILSDRKDTTLIFSLYYRDKQVGIVIYNTSLININKYSKLTVSLNNVIQQILLYKKIVKFSNQVSGKIENNNVKNEDTKKRVTQFLINIAHETQTPLTIISNNLNKYFKKYKSNKELMTIKKNIDKLLENMTDYLDSDNIIKKHQVIYNQKINISELLKNKLIFFTEIADSKIIKLKSNIEENIFIKADPSVIDKLINNLIGKIIKNIDEKGVVDVTVISGINDNLIIKISSENMYLVERGKSSVFFPFNNVNNKKQDTTGINIDLFRVKRIIENLNGNFKIIPLPNKGCSIIISIEKCLNLQNENLNIENYKLINNIGNNKISRNLLSNSQKNILLIEQNIDMLLYLYDELSEEYNIIIAKDTNEALSKLNIQNKIDLIIFDFVVHELLKCELFRKLINDKALNQIPIIFLIAKLSEYENINKLGIKAADCIKKPFNIYELKFKINSIITIKENLTKAIIENAIYSLKSSIDDTLKIKDIKLSDFENMIKKYNITKREKEILTILSNGYEYKEIAYKLNISYKTVDGHLQNVYKKTGTKNKIELINLFYRK